MHREIKMLYDEEIEFSKTKKLEKFYEECIRREVYGVRFLRKKGVTKFIVNSMFAKEMVQRDLRGCNVAIYQAFHPVIFTENDVKRIAGDGKHQEKIMPVIGSFGIPGQSKATHEILRAVAELRKRRRVKFVLAGYGVTEFVRKLVYEMHDDDLFIESPSDDELLILMSEVDVAVQLCPKNLGESSGIVPMLIGIGVKTIVSASGAFMEYGEAVSFVGSTVKIDELVQKIETELLEEQRKEAMTAYTCAHSIAKVWKCIDEGFE